MKRGLVLAVLDACQMEKIFFDIYYKFLGYYDIDGIIKANNTADLREGVAVEYVICEPTTNRFNLYQGRIKEQHRAAE